MAKQDDTREQSRLEQTIEAERGMLLQANAVLRCLYEVLLYADGEDAIKYAEAAHVVSSLVDDCVARLDSVRLRPLIEELKRGGKPDDGTTLRDSDSAIYELEESCRIRITEQLLSALPERGGPFATGRRRRALAINAPVAPFLL